MFSFSYYLCTIAYRHKNQAHSPLITSQTKIRLIKKWKLKLNFQLCFFKTQKIGKIQWFFFLWLASDETSSVHMWKLNVIPVKGNLLKDTISLYKKNIPRPSVIHARAACSLSPSLPSLGLSGTRWLVASQKSAHHLQNSLCNQRDFSSLFQLKSCKSSLSLFNSDHHSNEAQRIFLYYRIVCANKCPKERFSLFHPSSI